MDMEPAPGKGWDETAKRAALDLGWTEPCGPSGVKPVCRLGPAIHLVAYNGFEDGNHGDPGNTDSPHLHVSWGSSGYGSCPNALCGPHEWVMAFPLTG